MLQDFVKKEFTPEEQAFNIEEERKQAFLEESGLEGVDAKKLRSSMLSADEAIAANEELMQDIRARKCRKPDWDEYIDEKRRWGRALHHSEIILRLRRLIPNLCVTEGTMKDTLSLYVWDRTQPFLGKTGGTVFIGWLHRGWNPEYEIDKVNDAGVAVGQLRGWRTTLLRMICRRDSVTFAPKSLFSEEQAYSEFGAPTQGETASNFRMYLHKFRNTSPERARLDQKMLEAYQNYQFC